MASTEFAAARKRAAHPFGIILLLSVLVNLLMLTGSIYMLQVYDRVLPSGSVETLISLTSVMLFLFAMMGLLDHGRARIAARAGAGFQSDLDGPVFAASLDAARGDPQDAATAAGSRDLETLSRLAASPAFLALFDLPWIPLFIGAIFVLHPALGLLAVGGGAILVAAAIAGQVMSAPRQEASAAAALAADRMLREIRSGNDTVSSLGIGRAVFLRWRELQRLSILSWLDLSDRHGAFSVFSRTFRQILQSLILGFGAFLVIRGEMSAGGMIASSILVGRALAPIDVLIGQWGALQKARGSWKRLSGLMTHAPAAARTALPAPAGHVRLENVVAGHLPGSPVLRGISFEVGPGSALAIVGPSGSGKTTIGRLLTGGLTPASGRVLLDGAPLGQYDPDRIGSHVGYLPQQVRFLRGTIAENISGFAADASAAAIVEAARIAGAHELIVSLKAGYDTLLDPDAPCLSGGQLQRIGLARAVHGVPALVVLDEPNSSLDHDGSIRLNRAVREMRSRGAAVIVMAHRPSAIEECDLILVLDGGAVRAFGPREKILSPAGIREGEAA
ncbi:type I secretion system permease/ATPase [Defluviimonas salinarum]|uniref:Type I secretion system permease/ATPase n=1 Tax=Defluviimonas salinarum TaxID=2992147 RepID=A0ABT3J487_9RHOB|nr:type I secretion system permease/ATPase [Defluviimonas salinarum]MCW3782488.1 type I secretion system permease/ATPase [Defluviimonas salinarum]